MALRKSKFLESEKAVEQEIMAWAFQNRWSLDVYDSKGSYSETRGQYARNTGIKTGHPDLAGSDNLGRAVYLELKKAGQASKCRLEQHQFLSRKIESNCFAMVVDSVQVLETTYHTWLKLRNEGKEKEARDYLRGLLPTKVLVQGRTLEIQND